MVSISEEHIPHLSNIKLNLKNRKYPKSPEINIPSPYFNVSIVGSRNSGKTTFCCKLIYLYEKYGLYMDNKKLDIRTFLISSTYSANPVFDSLTSLANEDIFENYSDSVITTIIDDIKLKIEETEEYKLI